MGNSQEYKVDRALKIESNRETGVKRHLWPLGLYAFSGLLACPKCGVRTKDHRTLDH